MARYIDVDKLIEVLRYKHKPLIDVGSLVWFLYNSVEETIDEQPTADVVEVVRCKDCAHYIEMKGFDYNGRKARSCVWHSALRRENDYCSDAIRTPKERGGEK